MEIVSNFIEDTSYIDYSIIILLFVSHTNFSFYNQPNLSFINNFMKQYQLEEKPLKILQNHTKEKLSQIQSLMQEYELLFDYGVIKQNQDTVNEQNRQFNSKQKERNGKSKFQQNDLFYCGVCKKQFTSAKLTLDHKKYYHNDISDILQCQYCQKSYFGTKSLIQHQIRHHKQDLKRTKSENQNKIQNFEQIQAGQPLQNMKQ
ncbi:hypothetical protein pb186bvf_003667 [Paramecium bursaria]